MKSAFATFQSKAIFCCIVAIVSESGPAHPCFLVAKKRYVGYAYEAPDQQVPVFDAKGAAVGIGWRQNESKEAHEES